MINCASHASQTEHQAGFCMFHLGIIADVSRFAHKPSWAYRTTLCAYLFISGYTEATKRGHEKNGDAGMHTRQHGEHLPPWPHPAPTLGSASPDCATSL